MEMTFFTPQTLVKIIKEQIIPNHDAEGIASLARYYCHKNWTSMGTYIYHKFSPLTKEQQLFIHQNIELEDLHDVFTNYTELVYDEIQNEWDITEETEGLEVDSDEYNEAVWEMMNDHFDINRPETAVCLALVSLLETYLNEKIENGEVDLRLELEVEVPNFDIDEQDDYYLDFDYEDAQWKLFNNKYEVITLEQLKEQF